MQRYALILASLSSLTVTVFAACSGDDPTFGEATSSSSGTGPGSAMSASSAQSSGAGAEGGSSASSGIGGGQGGSGNEGGTPTCASICEELDQGCGLDGACASLGNDCNPGNFTHCNFMCLLDAPCEELNALIAGEPAGNLGTCLGVCHDGPFCRDCMVGHCGAELDACAANPECDAWFTCAHGCDSPDCFTACDTQHAGASALFEPVYDCTCTHCDDLCVNILDACDQ